MFLQKHIEIQVSGLSVMPQSYVPSRCLCLFVFSMKKRIKYIFCTCCSAMCNFNSLFPTGVFDNCSHSLSDKGWSVGIRTFEPGSTKDARFYFTLRTDRAVKATTVYSHQRYRANAWTHLMATYDGLHMTLYTDGAKVCHFELCPYLTINLLIC